LPGNSDSPEDWACFGFPLRARPERRRLLIALCGAAQGNPKRSSGPRGLTGSDPRDQLAIRFVDMPHDPVAQKIGYLRSIEMPLFKRVALVRNFRQQRVVPFCVRLRLRIAGLAHQRFLELKMLKGEIDERLQKLERMAFEGNCTGIDQAFDQGIRQQKHLVVLLVDVSMAKPYDLGPVEVRLKRAGQSSALAVEFHKSGVLSTAKPERYLACIAIVGPYA
jgi:hypothetical protein